MQDRNSTLKDFALGVGLALVASGAIAAAQQVGTGPAKGARQDPAAPCCGITAIDLKAGVITAKVTRTGQVFTLEGIGSTALAGFKVGESFDLACAVPPSGGTTGASGNASTSGSPTTATISSGNCGSNVSRNANTKPVQPQPKYRPTDCTVINLAGARTPVACPQQDVQIKILK